LSFDRFVVLFFVVGVDLGEAWSLKCRGIVYGVIGKIQFFPGEMPARLLRACKLHHLFKLSLHVENFSSAYLNRLKRFLCISVLNEMKSAWQEI